MLLKDRRRHGRRRRATWMYLCVSAKKLIRF